MKGKTQDTINTPTIEEIETALKKLKNNKAPQTDSIPAELLKFGGDGLKHIFSSVWIKEEIPKERLRAVICPLYKKGDPLECASMRHQSVTCNIQCIFCYLVFVRSVTYGNRAR